jgi:hypothetical protein
MSAHIHSHEYVAGLLNNARYEATRSRHAGRDFYYCHCPYILHRERGQSPLAIGHRTVRDEHGRLESERPAVPLQEAQDLIQHLHGRHYQIHLPGLSSRAPDMVFYPVAGGWEITRQ